MCVSEKVVVWLTCFDVEAKMDDVKSKVDEAFKMSTEAKEGVKKV